MQNRMAIKIDTVAEMVKVTMSQCEEVLCKECFLRSLQMRGDKLAIRSMILTGFEPAPPSAKCANCSPN